MNRKLKFTDAEVRSILEQLTRYYNSKKTRETDRNDIEYLRKRIKEEIGVS